MLSLTLATYGAIAFILGNYLCVQTRWRLAGVWLGSLGVFVLTLVLYYVWTPMDQAFSTEPLFIGVWIALPMLWHYRNGGMLVPLRELLAAFSWSLIAILVSFLAPSRIPESLINVFATSLLSSAAEPAATLVLIITLPTVFLAALEAGPHLNRPHRPYIFGVGFAVFFVGLTSLQGEPFPENMAIADFVLLSATLLVAIWLRATIHVTWLRVFVELLLWFVLFVVTLIATQGYAR